MPPSSPRASSPPRPSSSIRTVRVPRKCQLVTPWVRRRSPMARSNASMALPRSSRSRASVPREPHAAPWMFGSSVASSASRSAASISWSSSRTAWISPVTISAWGSRPNPKRRPDLPQSKIGPLGDLQFPPEDLDAPLVVPHRRATAEHVQALAGHLRECEPFGDGEGPRGELDSRVVAAARHLDLRPERPHAGEQALVVGRPRQPGGLGHRGHHRARPGGGRAPRGDPRQPDTGSAACGEYRWLVRLAKRTHWRRGPPTCASRCMCYSPCKYYRDCNHLGWSTADGWAHRAQQAAHTPADR